MAKKKPTADAADPADELFDADAPNEEAAAQDSAAAPEAPSAPAAGGESAAQESEQLAAGSGQHEDKRRSLTGHRLELPLAGDDSHGYVSRHLEVSLDSRQAATLKRLYLGLEASGAKLNESRPVKSAADAFRFVLNQLADSADDD